MRRKPVQLTPKSKKLMEERGYLVGKTEHWNSFAGIRQDLFGFIDLLAIGAGFTVGVQVTSKANISSRVKKIRESKEAKLLLESGWTLIVHGWYQDDKKHWQVKEVIVDVGE